MKHEKEKKLPENWVQTTIEAIAYNVTDGSHNPPRKLQTGIPMLSARNIVNGSILFDEVRYISPEDFKNENARAKLEQGDVLLTIVGTIGRTAIIKDFKRKFSLQRSVAVIKPAIPAKYLMYILQSPDFQRQLLNYSKGTAQKGVYLKTLGSLTFPLPPLAEQYRIVEKIEELFSELDKAQESLLNAQKQLETYRQVVLKDAFEGKLTAEWRVELGIDKHYVNIALKDCCELITDGTHYSPKSSEIGIPYITVKDIENDIINFNTCKKISKNDYLKLKNEGNNPLINDVLFSKDGTVGKVSIVDFYKEFVILSSLAILRPKTTILKSKYLFYSLKSAFFIRQALDNKKGVAIRRIVLRDLKELFIKITRIQEQEKVVQEIEYRFTLIENLEKSITENLKRIEVFRHTVSQKAFLGQLVPQYETDEPADELLKRIKEGIIVYQSQQKEIAKSKPQKLVFMESNKTVKEILEETTEPMETKEVWQKSKHKDDIEKFYEVLKRLDRNKEIVEIKGESTTFLKIVK